MQPEDRKTPAQIGQRVLALRRVEVVRQRPPPFGEREVRPVLLAGLGQLHEIRLPVRVGNPVLGLKPQPELLVVGVRLARLFHPHLWRRRVSVARPNVSEVCTL